MVMSTYIFAAAVTVGAYKCYKGLTRKLHPDQQVLIVGGGYGGIKLASELKGRGNFTLIDPKDAFHHNMAALRAAVVPGFSNKTFIPYKPTFGDNFKQGFVKDIDLDNKTIVLDNNETLPFTQLVLATGSTGPFPGKCDHSDGCSVNLAKQYEDYALEIQAAKRILIIGGGAVGVELSGEIAGEYPDKEVTILHGSDKIVGDVLTREARDLIMEKLEAKNVKVIFNEKVSLTGLPLNERVSGGITVTTSSGQKLEADIVIPCFGSTVNTYGFATALRDSMNERGQLKVNECLQVVGRDDVFAIGDCNDIEIVKLAMEAARQGRKTFENLVHIGKNESLEKYNPDTFRNFLVVNIGRDGGVCDGDNHVFGDFMARILKAKHVFVDHIWWEMGQPVPEEPKN